MSIIHIKRIPIRKQSTIFELYVDSNPAGKITFSCGWIDDLIIYNGYNGKGYARLLMNVILAEYGHEKIELIAVGDDKSCPTSELVKFYRTFGFRGHKKTEDGVKMKRPPGQMKCFTFKFK